MTGYSKVLHDMITHLIEGNWSVEEFRDKYYGYYLEEVPESALTDAEVGLFGAIQEKLDWTDPSPDKESRKYGWMDNREFVKWVESMIMKKVEDSV